MGRWAFAAGLIWAGFAMSAAADPPAADPANDAKVAVARQIVALRSDASEMQFFTARLPYYTGAIQSSAHLSDAEQAQLPRILEEVYRAALQPSHEHTAETYARIFTLVQLQQLLDFDNSDTGRALLAHQDELTQDSIALQRVFNAAVLSGTAQRIQDMRGAAAQ